MVATESHDISFRAVFGSDRGHTASDALHAEQPLSRELRAQLAQQRVAANPSLVQAGDGIELGDGGFLVATPDDDGMIAIRDEYGESIEAFRPEEDKWAQYADLFGVIPSDFEENDDDW